MSRFPRAARRSRPRRCGAVVIIGCAKRPKTLPRLGAATPPVKPDLRLDIYDGIGREIAPDRGASYEPDGARRLARSGFGRTRARGPPFRPRDESRRCRGNLARWLTVLVQVPRPRPDIAIIEFVSNDAALHRLESLVESPASVTAIIHRLRAASTDIRVYLMTMSPATGLHGLLRLQFAPLRPLSEFCGIWAQLWGNCGAMGAQDDS